jgi:hypothetical protein
VLQAATTGLNILPLRSLRLTGPPRHVVPRRWGQLRGPLPAAASPRQPHRSANGSGATPSSKDARAPTQQPAASGGGGGAVIERTSSVEDVLAAVRRHGPNPSTNVAVAALEALARLLKPVHGPGSDQPRAPPLREDTKQALQVGEQAPLDVPLALSSKRAYCIAETVF